MKQYDLNEIQQMQEKALRRVRDMDTAARRAVEEPVFYPTGNSHKAVSHSEPAKGHIPMPVNLPAGHVGNASAPQPQASSDSHAEFLRSILDDPDKALLMSLLMLFKGDKANEELMMALIYIMLS